MAKDIVCNNEVDMKKERFSSWHDGREFWFDSRECKSLFDADPDRYIKVEFGKTEAGQKVREISERTVERSKSHAKAIFSDRKRDLAETASGISHALHETSKSLRDQHYEDTARLVNKSAEQIDSLSGRLRDSDADKIISDAEDYVRQRPAFSIGGALAAGFLLARFVKSGASENIGH
jgi:YHS domain-containing protein/ElaB/YqjD/DUF883 family membrane-anchored ribosome-binding protein